MVNLIDNVDRKILLELDKNARISDIKLTKIIGKSKEAVRYRIKKLIDEKIILGFTAWIDPTKLGYQTGKLYLNLTNIPNKKKQFIEDMKKDKRLFWLGIAEGEWNAGLTFFVKSNEEFFNLKNQIFSKYKNLIIESHTASVVSVHFHDKTFFHKQETRWNEMFKNPESKTIDKISINILKELLNNSRINIVDIANKYKTSVDIIRNRINKLEVDKIIVRYTTIINYQKLGYEFYKTFLYFKNLNDDDMDILMNYCLHNPNIIHLVKQISPWDIELEIMCENYEIYNKIISELTEKFSDIIKKVETAIMSEDYVFPSKKLVFE